MDRITLNQLLIQNRCLSTINTFLVYNGGDFLSYGVSKVENFIKLQSVEEDILFCRCQGAKPYCDPYIRGVYIPQFEPEWGRFTVPKYSFISVKSRNPCIRSIHSKWSWPVRIFYNKINHIEEIGYTNDRGFQNTFTIFKPLFFTNAESLFKKYIEN